MALQLSRTAAHWYSVSAGDVAKHACLCNLIGKQAHPPIFWSLARLLRCVTLKGFEICHFTQHTHARFRVQSVTAKYGRSSFVS